MSRAVDNFLKKNNVDLIIATSVEPFVFTTNKIPLYIITGGTVKLLYDNYASSDKWSGLYYKWLNYRSVTVTKKACKTICASQYCANSLIQDYKIHPDKINVIPYGTNLKPQGYIKRIISISDRINFLFVGKGWERKGGEDTIKLCDELKQKGLNIRLTVVGSIVPESFQRNYLINYGYLDKEITEEYNLLLDLYTKAHFFIMPTKAEFFGVVFSEAASFSLPVISRKIGPVPEIVIDNHSGLLIEEEPDIKYESQRIYYVICNNTRYRELSENAYRRYEEVLNWDSYMLKLKEIISER